MPNRLEKVFGTDALYGIEATIDSVRMVNEDLGKKSLQVNLSSPGAYSGSCNIPEEQINDLIAAYSLRSIRTIEELKGKPVYAIYEKTTLKGIIPR